jgi:hypothetical protein
MLQQKLATLAIFLLQTSLVRPAILPSEYLDARDNGAFNASIDARDDNHPLTPGERNMLNIQNNAYKGVFWDLAYPGGNGPDGTAGSPQDGGCYVYQYNILVEATRNAVRLASFSGSDLYMEDRSFNKYFVRNSVASVGGRWTVSFLLSIHISSFYRDLYNLVQQRCSEYICLDTSQYATAFEIST